MAQGDFTFSNNAFTGSNAGGAYIANEVGWAAFTSSTATSEVDTKALQGATVSVDKAKGIVEAFAAAIGNKDSVGDIIIPGAFNKSLTRRKPRVVWGHNWNEPVGKVLEIEEVTSTDPRLPPKMRAAGVGGLYVKVQFNLNSERGREAFSTVAFFGEEQEWSIGYKTLIKNFDPNRRANILEEVELYEVSPVLHGANQLTGTVSVKGENGETIEDKSPMGDMPQTGVIASALTSVMKDAVRIRHIDGPTVVFDTTKAGPYVTRLAVSDGEMRFEKPRRVRMRIVLSPLEEQAEVKPGCGCGGNCEKGAGGGCECGESCKGNCGDNVDESIFDVETIYLEKDADDEIETKAGRVVANRNMRKLRQALAILEEIVADGSPPVSEEDLERKKVKTLLDLYDDAKGDTNHVVFDETDGVSGLILEVAVTDASDVKEVLQRVNSQIFAKSLAVVAPGEAEFGKGATVKMFLTSSNVEAVEDAVSDLDTFEKKVDVLDFYGVESKSLEEAFFN